MDLHVLLHCSCHLVFSSTCLGTRSVHAAHARLPTRTWTRTWIIARACTYLDPDLDYSPGYNPSTRTWIIARAIII